MKWYNKLGGEMSGINHGSKICPCTCKHEGQDKIYGKQNRLHNYCKHPVTKTDMKGLRCTVCGRVKEV